MAVLMNLEREVKSSFDMGWHRVTIEYNKYWATMRICVDGELVGKRSHSFWAPKRDEYSFTVDGERLCLLKERPPWRGKWAISNFTVSANGTPVHEFSG
jgi:hypothetical protein